MHARNRTWLLGSDPAERCRQRTMPVEGGDGSTLSLDFTTGVLDPRLSFERLSTATFINSSGLVQYANANIVRQSENCGSWSGAQNIPPTADAAVAPNGTQTADQLNLLASSYRYQVTTATYAVGQPYVASIWMRTVSGTASVGFRIANSVTGANSAIATCSVTETWQRFNTPAFTLSDTANRVIDVGIDQRSIVSGPNVAANIYVWGLQLQPGTSVGGYLPTTTTEEFDVPRFDYDPTTPFAPRGLLIEGAATNLVTQSNGGTSVWTIGGNRTPTNNTTDLVSPDGTNNATSLVCGTAGNYASFATSVTGLTGGGTYTVSYWIRGPVGHSPRLYAVNGTVGDVTPTATTGTYNNTGWTRLTQTYTLPAATTQVYVYFLSANIGVTGETYYIYGFQLEAGSGASSYIPTGASTGTRNADNCTMNDITALNYSTTNGTMLYVGQFTKINSVSFPTRAGFQTAGGANPTFEIFTNGSLIYSAARSATANPERNTTITTNSSIKFATAFDASLASNEVTICLNGGTVLGSSATGLTATYTPTIFALGRAGYDLYYPSGTIAQVKYWPTTLSNAQLQSLTT